MTWIKTSTFSRSLNAQELFCFWMKSKENFKTTLDLMHTQLFHMQWTWNSQRFWQLKWYLLLFSQNYQHFVTAPCDEQKHFSESRDVDTISRVQGELDDLKDVMVKNIGKKRIVKYATWFSFSSSGVHCN